MTNKYRLKIRINIILNKPFENEIIMKLEKIKLQQNLNK